jgi:response regulator of citrate/malate metabolism
MKKNQSILFVSVGLIGLGLYFFYKQSKQPKLAEEPSENSNENNTQTTKSDFDKVLKRGSKGIEVEILQKALRQLDVDGDFGALTEARLKKVMGISQTSINQYNEFIRNQKPKTQTTQNVFQPYNVFKP